MTQIVAVTWDDAHGSSGTLATHELEHTPYRFIAVGFLVRSDEKGISLAFEKGEDGKWRDVTFIPRAMVIVEKMLGNLDKWPTLGRSKKFKKNAESIISLTDTVEKPKAGDTLQLPTNESGKSKTTSVPSV